MSNSVEVSLQIDDSKVHVVSRKQRLRAVSVEVLTTVHDHLTNSGRAEDNEAKAIAEAITWLNDMEV